MSNTVNNKLIAAIGKINVDLVFGGLKRLPDTGEELYSESFDVLLGGGNKETIRKANPVKVIENAKARREIRKKTKISQIELNNFMNYNGDPMPDPKEVVAHGG